MPKKGETSPNRKRQEQYEMMGQGLTYKVFAGRWRKRIMREEARMKIDGYYKIQKKLDTSDAGTGPKPMKLGSLKEQGKCEKPKLVGVTNSRQYIDAMNYSRKQTDIIEVTPPIEPTVVEKKKFMTPARLDGYLLYLIILLQVTIFSFDMISVLMPEPTTNTVIVKVKEKVVYKKPIKKVTTNVCNK